MSAQSSSSDAPETLDVLGVGFGPSNLALALAVQEHNEQSPGDQRIRASFVEQQAAFGWHRGMLIEGATMQVSFLKDLVTMRDPTSPRSFLNYLQGQGRLADFINTKTMFPSRIEFHDYLEWCAADVRHLVSYGTRAVGVHPVAGRADGRIEELEVVLRDVATERSRVVRTRNLVLATGLVPSVPPGVARSPRIWHNSEFLHRLAAVDDDPDSAPRRFVVVGAGQSAAETTEHLHSRYPDAEVHSVFSRYGYSPADDTSFANRIFDPDAVDHFYSAPGDVKQMLMDYHANTNYSVVDPELIQELYTRAYQEKVHGRQRLHVHGACRVAGVREPAGDAADDGAGGADGADIEVDIEFLPTGERETVGTDVVVYATGYRPIDPTTLLGDLGMWCRRAENGELLVERDYRLTTEEPLDAGIYVQGPTEHTHGISSTLLSTTAVRVGEIVASLRGRRPATAAARASPAPRPRPEDDGDEPVDGGPLSPDARVVDHAGNRPVGS
ncbi:lysine/ornithine N-monooxygenase [Actinomycetospora sp. NBRC 106375]|uniref:lysine N(6)-hydroxylase/L-ornithine N(5)-oxygenase family protein n=1 Tax=Actinomycetospora sp. NBRC 106375 TaxID=3032207 RepID=UPI0024A089D5|nr:lysine N(6)-hydroxylase/L-ornithine N(5)-oxygenase family protein [Actinomycetospora sp. NBRC 106375]GLZ47945.1 lysine/ornithine N-monooxygenase [Actinomycetospora sp. NBRC 106375]